LGEPQEKQNGSGKQNGVFCRPAMQNGHFSLCESHSICWSTDCKM